MKIGFIGAGKVGCSLARYFSSRGIAVSGFFSFSGKDTGFFGFNSCNELAKNSSVIFITVPDGKIADTAALIPKDYNGIVCHCSGSLSSDVTGFARSCSVHPMCAVSTPKTDLSGAFFTLEGSLDAVGEISALLICCNNPFTVIKKEDKVKYHAAACFASNFVVAVCQKAYELLEQCGFDEESAKAALTPLMSANMDNICSSSPVSALTGPVERNDILTVQKHLLSLDCDSAQMYKACSKTLLELARHRHPNSDYSKMRRLLD
ncbi:MAG: DUF2520 domain-containing protein [Clostridiales bacterium]|nr:DUF2520 domain-containing protein [Clostridiales bacterium]